MFWDFCLHDESLITISPQSFKTYLTEVTSNKKCLNDNICFSCKKYVLSNFLNRECSCHKAFQVIRVLACDRRKYVNNGNKGTRRKNC